MTTEHTLTGNLADLAGSSTPSRITLATIDTNLDGEALKDYDNNEVRLDGPKQLTIAADGTFSIDLIATDSTGTNVLDDSLRYIVRVSYKDATGRTRSWDSGYFDLTADADLSDKAGTDVSIPVVPGPSPSLLDPATAANVNDPDSQTYAAILAGFMRGQIVTHPRWGADKTGSTDSTAAIQACANFVRDNGGGAVYHPEGDYLTSATLVVDGSSVTLIGEGGGYDANGIADLRASAATRIVFSSTATPAPMVRFTSVAGAAPKTGGGVVGMMLDANNRATRCLEIRTWRGGQFEDLFLYAATAEMLYTGSISGTLSMTPYDVQFNRFVRVTTSARNQTGNTAHAARLTGGQGAGATAGGNTSFNQFIGCQLRCRDNHALVLEDTDNNTFFGCQAGRDIGTGYSVVLSSADQDSSGSVLTGRHARFNQFYGCEFKNGVYARAGQTGNSSSFGNQFYGLNYSNASPQVTYETAAGGSAAAEARVYSSTAAEFLNATKLALADNITNVATARTNLGTESARIKNGSSDHIRLESGDGLSEWQVSIDNGPGNFRIVRTAGSGGIRLGEAAGKLGFYGVTPVVKAASPGTATGTDAAVINAVVTALRNLGLVA